MRERGKCVELGLPACGIVWIDGRFLVRTSGFRFGISWLQCGVLDLFLRRDGHICDSTIIAVTAASCHSRGVAFQLPEDFEARSQAVTWEGVCAVHFHLADMASVNIGPYDEGCFTFS
ncbi:hypothetical protein BRN07_00010, partial [Xanthomonas oryzae pv. oryzae]